MFQTKLTPRIKIGLALIYLAGLGYLAELIIPFQNIAHKGLIWIVVLLLAEASFVAGVAILGKPLYRELKAKFIEHLHSKAKK
jgi:hypothetical protein